MFTEVPFWPFQRTFFVHLMPFNKRDVFEAQHFLGTTSTLWWKMSTHLWLEIPTEDAGESALGTRGAWMKYLGNLHNHYRPEGIFYLPESQWVISWTAELGMTAMGGCSTALQTGRDFQELVCEKTQSSDSVPASRGGTTKPWYEIPLWMMGMWLITRDIQFLPHPPAETPTADISVTQTSSRYKLETKS